MKFNPLTFPDYLSLLLIFDCVDFICVRFRRTRIGCDLAHVPASQFVPRGTINSRRHCQSLIKQIYIFRAATYNPGQKDLGQLIFFVAFYARFQLLTKFKAPAVSRVIKSPLFKLKLMKCSNHFVQDCI